MDSFYKLLFDFVLEKLKRVVIANCNETLSTTGNLNIIRYGVSWDKNLLNYLSN